MKTDFLIGAWDPGTLWSDFGIRSDVVVSGRDIFEYSILNESPVAIHTRLSSR